MLTLKKNGLISGALGAVLLLAGSIASAQVPAPTPNPYQPGFEQLLRNAPRDKADLIDLKMRARPKSRRPILGARREAAE